MLDATMTHQLEALLACHCTASPLAPETTPQSLKRLLWELSQGSAYPE